MHAGADIAADFQLLARLDMITHHHQHFPQVLERGHPVRVVAVFAAHTVGLLHVIHRLGILADGLVQHAQVGQGHGHAPLVVQILVDLQAALDIRHGIGQMGVRPADAAQGVVERGHRDGIFGLPIGHIQQGQVGQVMGVIQMPLAETGPGQPVGQPAPQRGVGLTSVAAQRIQPLVEQVHRLVQVALPGADIGQFAQGVDQHGDSSGIVQWAGAHAPGRAVIVDHALQQAGGVFKFAIKFERPGQAHPGTLHRQDGDIGDAFQQGQGAAVEVGHRLVGEILRGLFGRRQQVRNRPLGVGAFGKVMSQDLVPLTRQPVSAGLDGLGGQQVELAQLAL